MAKKLLFLVFLTLLSSPALAKKNFLETIQENLKKALTPSEFVCDKYERQEYETMVLRPGFHLPFTEVHPKKRVCAEWETDTDSAIGKKCKSYKYVNTSKEEESSMYQKVKRYRTVCVEGHSTR